MSGRPTSGTGQATGFNRLWLVGLIAVCAAAASALWAVTLLPIADPLPSQLQGWRTVGSYFDRPPPWPGKPWTIDGRTVPPAELAASAGPSHCGWDAVTFLSVGWPPGTISTSASQDRQYIRDPAGRIHQGRLLGSWEHNPKIPADARDSGYRYGALDLYLAPSDEDIYAYLVAPSDSERWPRSDPLTLCS